MRPARRLCYLAWRRGVAPVCVTRGASGLPGSAPQQVPKLFPLWEEIWETRPTTKSRWGNEPVFCGKLCKTAVT
jgi:hypothetical protein